MKILFILKQNVKGENPEEKNIVKDGDVMHFSFNVVSRKLNNKERNLQGNFAGFF
jgi:hypothetical protein